MKEKRKQAKNLDVKVVDDYEEQSTQNAPQPLPKLAARINNLRQQRSMSPVNSDFIEVGSGVTGGLAHANLRK